MRVRLTIRAAECDPSGTAVEETRSAAPGEAEERQGRIRLTYREDLSEDNSAPTRVTILASDGKTIMRREGDFSATMIFEPGQTRTGTYRTPYGEIPFQIETRQAAVAGNTLSGELSLIYSLQIRGSGESHRRMRVAWEAEEPC